MKMYISIRLKSMTLQKFYGTYFRSLIKHADKQYHIFFGRNRNTKKEEAISQTLKKFTNLTLNHQRENS